MATTIVTKNGSGAPTASDLVAGELAVDLTNGRLYTENSGGTVLELGLNPSGNVNVTGTVTASSTLTAQKLVSTNGVLELDDNGSHNGVINSPASLFINIDSDGTNTGEDFVIGKDRTGTSGGIELFRVQEDGSVGIGTSLPAALIHGMSGDLFLTANSTAADSGQGVFFQSTTSGWATSAAHAAIYGKRVDASNGYLRFDTRQSGTTQEAMRIDSAGNVDLYQGNNLTWRFAAGSTIRGSMSVDSADNITFSNTSSNTERLRINSDGSLVLNNAGGDAQMYFGGTSGTNRMYIARSGSDSLFWNVSNGVMRFGTNNAEAMRIDASGNLLVSGTSLTEDDHWHTKDGTCYSYRASGVGRVHNQFFNAGSLRGEITSSPGGATLYTSISDSRVKENITDAVDAGSTIDALQVRQFDMIGGAHHDYGMVAQEIALVCPDSVYQPEDPEKMMSVDYSKLVPMLVKEIQSLRARVAQLES